MSSWQRKMLKEVVLEWGRGATPGRSHPEYYCEKPGIPWARVSDIKGKFLTETEVCLTGEGASQIKDRIPKGAVLLSVSGTIGKTAIAGTELTINQAVLGMVFDSEQVLPEYAYYYFQFYRPWLEAKANNVTIANLTKAQLENTEIVFPELEEQRFLTAVLGQAEKLAKGQDGMPRAMEQALYGVFQKYAEAIRRNGEWLRLGTCLTEPPLTGTSRKKDGKGFRCRFINTLSGGGWALKISGEEPIFETAAENPEKFTLKRGDLLLGRYPSEKEESCQIVAEDPGDAVWGSGLIRIRVREERLRPEFLLLWLHFYEASIGKTTSRSGMFSSGASVEGIPVPRVPLEIQDRLAGAVGKAMVLQKRGTEMKRKLEDFYQAMLGAAFTGKLTKQRFSEEQEPFGPAFLMRYHLTETPVQFWEEGFFPMAEWDAVLDDRERQILEYLSDFQREILRKYLEAREPMPVHTIFKQVKKEKKNRYRSYSVQDALAAVKILEGLGFLEKTVPEKIFLGETEVLDLHGRAVTIQKYQSAIGS